MASAVLRTSKLSPTPETSISVLGKRKWSETPPSTGQTYVLRVTSPPRNLYLDNTQGPHNDTSDHLEADNDRTEREAGPSTSKKSPRSRSASTSSNRRKSYICSWEGCDKAYTKPCRLAEHYRSHTNDRPFECSTCSKSFLRKVHLQAHERSHTSKEERPLVCSANKGCEQRFWTQQQLKVHEDVHRGKKPYK
ncbi:Strongly-conserved Zn-finger binding protein (TFIIIA), partial [Tulasnella sp. UAMH 9824]